MVNAVLLCACTSAVLIATVTAKNNGVAITPPMGFNPYNHMKSSGFTWAPDEPMLKAIATAMKTTGLQALGYEYVNLDAGWSLTDRDPKTKRPQPDPKLFPNIANGGLAKWLNGQGFKFGIYSDSGTLHCGGKGPGGLNHEKIDAEAYVAWGVEYLKYDNCNVPDNISQFPIPRYTAMSKALNSSAPKDKPILFNMCEWGVGDPATWGAAVSNSWRTTADISDLWWAMCELADVTAEWFQNAGPGHWNDPDLLEVGNGHMTTAEYRSQFAIWSLFKAPLLISTDVTQIKKEDLEILSNSEVIAINQDKLGVAGRLVEERPEDPAHLQVWAGPLANGKVAVVLWNRGNTTEEILARFVNLQLEGKATVRDCIAHKDLGVADGQITLNVSSHDVRVMVLTPTVPTLATATASAGTADEGVAAGSGADADVAWAAKWKDHGIKIPHSRVVWEAEKKAHPELYDAY